MTKNLSLTSFFLKTLKCPEQIEIEFLNNKNLQEKSNRKCKMANMNFPICMVQS